MKKAKKILLSALILILVAIISVAGTLAYLTSEDSDVNVMTMGNVKIDQIEKEWNETQTELVDFTQDKPLYPYVGKQDWENTEYENGAYRRFTMENVVDKYVTVKNTGKSNAYVRTIIAIEIGSLTDEDLAAYTISASVNSVNGSEFKYAGAWNWTDDFNTTIDGKRYNIMVAVHENEIAPGVETIPSLLQVYLNKNATNETVEKIDGNGNGRLDILVLSQGTQTNGFENAFTALDTSFGDVTEAKVQEWFTGMKLEIVSSIEGEYVVKDSDQIISLDSNAKTDFIQNNYKKLIINGNGYELESGSAGSYSLRIFGGETIINDLDMNSLGGGIGAAEGAKVTFNGNSIYVDTASTSGRYNFYATGAGTEITIEKGTFSWDPKDNQKRAYICAEDGSTVYVNGGTFGKASTRDGYTAGILTSGTGKVIITGGTFGFDPSKWVAEGYTAVQNGSTWTVVAE